MQDYLKIQSGPTHTTGHKFQHLLSVRVKGPKTPVFGFPAFCRYVDIVIKITDDKMTDVYRERLSHS